MENDAKDLIKDIDRQIDKFESEMKETPAEKLTKDIEKKLKEFERKNDKNAKELINYIDAKVKGMKNQSYNK